METSAEVPGPMILLALLIIGITVIVVVFTFILSPVTDLPPAPIDHHTNPPPVIPPVNETNGTPPISNLSNHTGYLINAMYPGPPTYETEGIGPDYCLAIFDNGNLSFGEMFASETYWNLMLHLHQNITVFYQQTTNGLKYMGLEVHS